MRFKRTEEGQPVGVFKEAHCSCDLDDVLRLSVSLTRAMLDGRQTTHVCHVGFAAAMLTSIANTVANHKQETPEDKACLQGHVSRYRAMLKEFDEFLAANYGAN